jgi:hypothetical protein
MIDIAGVSAIFRRRSYNSSYFWAALDRLRFRARLKTPDPSPERLGGICGL